MDRPLKVEVTNKKNTLFEYTDTYYARKACKHAEATAEGVHEISGAVNRMDTKLGDMAETFKTIQDHNQKMARSAEIATLRTQKADEEKREQKAIKNTVFAFKQDMEFVNSTNKGLARFLSLKALTGFCDRMLVPAINRLEEIGDKEYANNLIKTVYVGIEESYANLTDPEKDDLSRMERHSGEIGERKLAIDGLSNDFLARKALFNSEISRLAVNNNAFEKQKRLLLAANDKKLSNGNMGFRISLLFGLPLVSFPFFLKLEAGGFLAWCILSFMLFFARREYFNTALSALFNKDARKKPAESIQRELESEFAPAKIQADIGEKRKEMLLLESSFTTNEQKLKQEMATIEQALNQLMVKYNLNV